MYERAKEHQADKVNEAEDSHQIKHWLLDHQELLAPPKFNFKIIVIYQRISLLNTVCILQLVLKYKSFAECWAIAQISLCENLDYLIIINAEC